MEKSLVFVKPDGVKRQLIGQIVSRFEARGLQIKEMKMMAITASLAQQHYAEHVDKPFFPSLQN